jgi:hypothetical protein
MDRVSREEAEKYYIDQQTPVDLMLFEGVGFGEKFYFVCLRLRSDVLETIV